MSQLLKKSHLFINMILFFVYYDIITIIQKHMRNRDVTIMKMEMEMTFAYAKQET